MANSNFNILLGSKIDTAMLKTNIKNLDGKYSLKLNVQLNLADIKKQLSNTGLGELLTKTQKSASSETSANATAKATLQTDKYKLALDRLNASILKTKMSESQRAQTLSRVASIEKQEGVSLSTKTQQLGLVKSKVSDINEETKKTSQGLGEISQKFLTWYLLAGVLTGIVNLFKNVVTQVVNLDKAFTSLQLVTKMSNEEISKMKSEYISLAKEMGVTVSTVTDAADEFLRAGLSAKDATEALKASIVLSTVANMDAASSTQYLIAAMNAYKLEASELLSVVDKLSSIDVKAATSSEELAEALSVSASSAQLAGISLDKYLGMIATVSETTRQSASTIGNSFKTIFSRLQAVRIGSLVDEDGESISDVDRLLKGYNIDLMATTNNLTDMGALLDTLGTKWTSYTAAQKSEIATTVAGKQALCSNI